MGLFVESKNIRPSHPGALPVVESLPLHSGALLLPVVNTAARLEPLGHPACPDPVQSSWCKFCCAPTHPPRGLIPPSCVFLQGVSGLAGVYDSVRISSHGIACCPFHGGGMFRGPLAAAFPFSPCVPRMPVRIAAALTLLWLWLLHW